MTTNAETMAFISISISDAFNSYNEDIDKETLEDYVAKQILADLARAGLTISPTARSEP